MSLLLYLMLLEDIIVAISAGCNKPIFVTSLLRTISDESIVVYIFVYFHQNYSLYVKGNMPMIGLYNPSRVAIGQYNIHPNHYPLW